jgi:hypothetical protein
MSPATMPMPTMPILTMPAVTMPGESYCFEMGNELTYREIAPFVYEPTINQYGIIDRKIDGKIDGRIDGKINGRINGKINYKC